MSLSSIYHRLTDALAHMRFGAPVACVYHPLAYARAPHEQYLRRYGRGRRDVLLVGMNPGPWGMVQTGIPFGAVRVVREWLGITAPVAQPPTLHHKRPVLGFDCRREEVSGARLWGWAAREYGTPATFFERFFVANYCPLAFFDADGANRTPDRLPAADRAGLFAACDDALLRVVRHMKPRLVVGVGRFARDRASIALEPLGVAIASIPHPSPANPGAHHGWDRRVSTILRAEMDSLPRPPRAAGRPRVAG
jgi:single-strand selective monofunctional uracil DNA glycosylase